MKNEGYRFNKKLSDVNYSPRQPFTTSAYRPEMDFSAECDDQQTEFFQNLVGVVRWTVELGRIDIAFELSTLS